MPLCTLSLSLSRDLSAAIRRRVQARTARPTLCLPRRVLVYRRVAFSLKSVNIEMKNFSKRHLSRNVNRSLRCVFLRNIEPGVADMNVALEHWCHVACDRSAVDGELDVGTSRRCAPARSRLASLTCASSLVMRLLCRQRRMRAEYFFCSCFFFLCVSVPTSESSTMKIRIDQR